MKSVFAYLLLASVALAADQRGAGQSETVLETMNAYNDASGRHDAANAELMDALGTAANAHIQLASANMAAGLTEINKAFAVDDISPSPPPWYITRGVNPTEKTDALPRSVATKESAATAVAAAAEADAWRDEANLTLMQAASNAANLNSVAATQRLTASLSWAADQATAEYPSPPPPPTPIAPGYSVRVPAEKAALSVEAARAQDVAAGSY